jgi:hypothetical protein
VRQDCRAFQEQLSFSKKIVGQLSYGDNGDDEDEEEEEEEEEPVWTAYGPDWEGVFEKTL